MQLTLDEKEQEIRDEVRAFLAGNALRPEDLPHELDARVAVLRKWQRDVYDAGLVGIAWPEEYGGRGGARPPPTPAEPPMARSRAPQLFRAVAPQDLRASRLPPGPADHGH